PPSAANAVILLDSRDNIAVARVALPEGQRVEAGPVTVLTRSAIPAGHKVAIRSIPAGTHVYRYGNEIGFATKNIEPGEHVHEHNLAFHTHDASEVVPDQQPKRASKASHPESFLGFRRADGRVGTRNYIA